VPEPGVLVGFGNPVARYSFTRHNCGFMAVDAFLDTFPRVAWEVSAECHWVRVCRAGKELWIVKPQTYMNLSGKCVGPIMQKLALPIRNLLVVHDDKDLDLGVLRIRFNGGSGGHKGIASVSEALSDSHYYRLRIGIGSPPAGSSTSDYVLEQLDSSLAGIFSELLHRSAAAISTFISDGPARAMNIYNQRPETTSIQERGLSS